MNIIIETGRGPELSVNVSGPLLTIPNGLRVISARPGEMRLAVAGGLSSAGSAPDVLVGSIPLVSWNTDRHGYEVTHVAVPPPPPFVMSDVSEMWLEVVAESVAPPRSVVGQGDDAGMAELRPNGMRLDALGRAVAAAQRLLSEWPADEEAEVVWRAPEIPGVRIDLRATDRAAGRFAGFVAPDGHLIPVRVAGRRVGAIPWTSRTLSAAALALRAAVSGLPSLDHYVSRPAMVILERVATTASRDTVGLDPPVSAWPRLAAQALRLILAALAQLTANGPGADAVPLTDLWRLYEAWVALQVSRELAARFGQGAIVGTCQTWSTTDYDVTMTVQCSIGGVATAVSPPRWKWPVRSVSSDLIPDVLVCVQGRRGRRLIVVETKQRTSGTALDAGGVADAASKYVWGIRDAANDDHFPVMQVVVVTSAQVSRGMHAAAAARISTSWLLPGRGDGTMSSRLNAALTDALAGVR